MCLTVAELVEQLQDLPPEAKVINSPLVAANGYDTAATEVLVTHDYTPDEEPRNDWYAPDTHPDAPITGVTVQ